ncbi:hypothetical protein [Streptococcus equinus]|uniref:hypothetical protein n=1 Tax=Streptococcus equinus TaxID=1335 RepID=UPI000944F735|nr:hypothetical protein [Streptococcus equinus]
MNIAHLVSLEKSNELRYSTLILLKNFVWEIMLKMDKISKNVQKQEQKANDFENETILQFCNLNVTVILKWLVLAE